jgi:hypothetical protein
VDVLGDVPSRAAARLTAGAGDEEDKGDEMSLRTSRQGVQALFEF